MEWYHRVNPEWLQARNNFITASEVVKLLPVTATGRKRYGMDAKRLAVWANKQKFNPTEDDVCSTGAAARGHIMEPYAIDKFNALSIASQTFYHWDDILLYNEDTGTAWSPDGLTLSTPIGVTKANSADYASPVKGIEVKSYSADRHYDCLFKDKMKLEERWQIAMALYTVPSLTDMVLVFFNPNVPQYIGWYWYDRIDLKEELELIKQTVEEYNEFKKNIEKKLPSKISMNDPGWEPRIKREWEEKNQSTMNPLY